MKSITPPNTHQFGLTSVFFFMAGSAGVFFAARYHPIVTVLAYSAYLAAVLIVYVYADTGDAPDA